MKQEHVFNELSAFSLPAWNEIPDVGLYLDQVTKFINSYLEPFGMGVTPSMISNYVKLKIISREGKKIYSRERISALLFVAVMKTVLSMDQIRNVLSDCTGAESPEEFYTLFVKSLKAHLKEFESQPVRQETSESGMMDIITAAAANKIFLDMYFRLQYPQTD